MPLELQMYKHVPAIGFERQPIANLVPFIEGFIEKGRGFAVFQKTTGEDLSWEAVKTELREPRPLIGYGGAKTYPILSDPDQKVPGAFAIDQKRLIYSATISPLHNMRDAYTWSYGAAANFYTNASFATFLMEFESNGYEILGSDNLRSNIRGIPLNITGTVQLKDLLDNAQERTTRPPASRG